MTTDAKKTNPYAAMSWGERYLSPCSNGCLSSVSGHLEGCPVHCGCYDAPSDRGDTGGDRG